jgi:hypothetical protein
MTSTDNQTQNGTEDATLPIQEMAAGEAQDVDLALPDLLSRTASLATQDPHQETTSTSTPVSSPTPQESSMPGTSEEATRKRNAKTVQIAGNALLVKDLTVADGDGKRIHWKEMADKKGITHATAYGRITSQNWDHESDLIKALSMPTRGKGHAQEYENGNGGAIHTESPEPQHHQSEVQTAAIRANMPDDITDQLSKIEKAVQAARIVNGLDLDPGIRGQLFVTALKAAMATMQKVLDSTEKGE